MFRFVDCTRARNHYPAPITNYAKSLITTCHPTSRDQRLTRILYAF